MKPPAADVKRKKRIIQMKKVLQALAIAVLGLVLMVGIGTIVHASASGGIYPLGNGWVFGAANDYISHFGGTPVQRQSLTNTAAVSGTVSITGQTATAAVATTAILSNLTQSVTITNGVGGSWTITFATNSVVGTPVVSIAAVAAVTNLTGTTTIAGFATTNQANQIITALRNLNLAQ